MKEHRRVPLSLLRKRLRVEDYECETPYDDRAASPRSVRVRLSQHVGQPAAPAVREGARVEPGAVVGTVGEAELGANVHASIAGTIRSVTRDFVEIEEL
jgi:Na+-translocating ferredoxin:NAD+ oxidoreductase RnfC subunit